MRLTDGAIHFIAPLAQVRARFEQLAAADDFEAIATWTRACDATTTRRAEAVALRQLARPIAVARARKRDVAVAPILEVVSQQAYDPDVQELLLALAREPAAKHRASLQQIADGIEDQRQATRDWTAAAPTTLAQLRAIYESTNPRSAERLRRKFPDQNVRPLLVELVASGYLADAATVQHIIADLRITEIRDEALLARLASEELAHASPLGALIQPIAAAHRDAFAVAANATTAVRLAEYERYRNDPEVLKPRAHGMDMALYRALNDALWGTARARPMLPELVVALVCDRRFEEAYAAYLAHVRCGADQAEAAIRDAIAFFAYGAAFTRPA